MTQAIEKVKDGLYEEYENLLLKRDQYEREASSCHVSYMKRFGELITASFQEKLECIKKKKEIAYYQKAMNSGKTVSPEELRTYIEKEMALYQKELEEILRRCESAKKSKTASDVDAYRCKKLYKRIAKRIHPDINPWTRGRMELAELWQRAVSAYHMLQVKELEEVEVIARTIMEQLGLDTFKIEIPNLEAKIEQLEEEINEILTTTPYTYGELLADEARVKEKTEELQKEIDDFRKYKDELDEALRQLMVFDGVSAMWSGQSQ